ncbi:MAG: hypothetical protein ACYCXK_10405 [Candidatus Humimicrobiaceae bacterium]
MARSVSVREIYFYIVCIISIIIFIIGLVGLSDGIINYLKPNTYLYQEKIPYETQYPNLSEEEINSLMEKEIANSVANERTFALKSMLRNTIMIIIAIPLFAFHWKKAQELWRLNLAD